MLIIIIHHENYMIVHVNQVELQFAHISRREQDCYYNTGVDQTWLVAKDSRCKPVYLRIIA